MTEKKNNLIGFKATDSEKEIIKKSADSMNMQVSEYLFYCMNKEQEKLGIFEMIQTEIRSALSVELAEKQTLVNQTVETYRDLRKSLGIINDQLIRYKITTDLIEQANNAKMDAQKIAKAIIESNETVDQTFKSLNRSIITLTNRLEILNKRGN